MCVRGGVRIQRPLALLPTPKKASCQGRRGKDPQGWQLPGLSNCTAAPVSNSNLKVDDDVLPAAHAAAVRKKGEEGWGEGVQREGEASAT
jgi:hypothetical protein